jgi:hypothetical protein
MTHKYNEDEMLIIDSIVDAGGEWPSQEQVSTALAKLYAVSEKE